MAAFGLLFSLPFFASSSFAQQVISYQGDASSNGTPLTGAHSVTLSIYSDSTGGTALYQETQTGVAFSSGIFNVLIGSNTANPLPLFNAGNYSGSSAAPDYFLGVSIDAGAELTPRSKLGASPTSWSSRFADSARTAGTAMNLAPSAGGVVTSVNTLGGAVTLSGAGGTTISKTGQTITISSSGGGGTGIQGVQNIDGSIAIVGPNGPTATVSIASGGVTTAKIATGAVTNAVVGSGSATNGEVLTANGSGGATWVAPTVFTLPYSQAVTSSSTLFATTNTGSGNAIQGNAGGTEGIAGVEGTTSSSTGIGVVGLASDGGSVTTNSGVCGSSDAGNGVAGLTQSGNAIKGFTSSTGVGIYGTTGTGATTARAGFFEITNSSATSNTVEVTNAGSGSDIMAVLSSPSTTSPVILAQNSTTSTAPAIQGEILSATPALLAAGVLGVNHGGNGNGIGVEGHCLSSGIGVYGRTETAGPGIEGVTNGTGDGIYGEADGAGNGVQGYGENGGIGVYAGAASVGSVCNAFLANMEGTTASSVNANNCAIFESAGTHVARIDRTGKGYFDNGTVTGGADVAEAFDVPSDRASYEPGDVLVISRNGTRQVEKCSEPYSRLVAGVYATKPGVLLTPDHIDADLSSKVPLGVIGVIPTKVSSENGPIAAGDLLVTSSTPGHAMKADLSKLQIGEAIGKALDNFNGPGAGVIEVLVGKY